MGSLQKIIYALSYQEFVSNMSIGKITDDTVEKKTASCIIEIMGEQDLLCFPFWFKKDHPNVLRLLFDDVDEPLHIKLFGEPEDGMDRIPVVPMNEHQGKQIVKFVEDNKDKNSFIVHCAAGISRSAAVAKYINYRFNEEEDDYLFNKNNPHIRPNQRIFSMLKEIYFT